MKNGSKINFLYRFGRDYYINEAKKSSGERLKFSQMNQRSQDENVSENQTFFNNHESRFIPNNHNNVTDSYIMDKFLNEGTNQQTSAVSRSLSLNFKTKKLKSNNSIYSESSKKPSVKKRPHSISDFNNLNSNVLRQYEAEMLFSDIKRDSFRPRSSTKNFALNPIFDELEGGSESLVSDQESGFVSTKNDFDLKSDSESSFGLNFSEVPKCVKTIYTDLPSIRRSSSLRSDRPSFYRNSTGSSFKERDGFTGL